MSDRVGDISAAMLAMAFFAGCVSDPIPEPLGPGDLGIVEPTIGSAPGSNFMPACGGHPLASRARVALDSWLDVLRHTDMCDVGTIRYATSQDNVDAVTDAAAALSGEPGPCGSQARSVVGRTHALAGKLRALDTETTEVCSGEYVTRDARDRLEATERSQERLQSMIRISLPEIN